MGFTFATPTAVGGTVLVIERIESQNYVAGTSGWDIAADGSAEFSNLIARGSFIGGNTAGAHVEINGPTTPQTVAFFTGEPDEQIPAKMYQQHSTTELSLSITSAVVAGQGVSSLGFTTNRVGGPARAALGGDVVQLTNNGSGNLVQVDHNGVALTAQLGTITLTGPVTADSLKLGPGSTVNDVQFGSGSFTVDATSTGRINIPHTLGVVPTAAFVTFQNSQYLGTADLSLSTTTSIVVIVRNITAAGAVLANGTAVVCRYLFII